MAYIKEYWDKKEERAKIARTHTNEMAEKYSGRIFFSVMDTKVYGPEVCELNDINVKENNNENTVIIIENLDTVTAGKIYNEFGKMALLNFASYKEPGGMFINGSKAQEECLCHASFLYNVLSQFEDTYYAWNNTHKNKALYLNRGLYTPNIYFECGNTNTDTYICDVITCAAPNKSAAQKYQNISDKENSEVLKSRIKFVLDMAKENDVEVLVLGAYGCGVFGQNPEEVATIFKEYLEKEYKCFKMVIFAIPDGRDGNLNVFKKVFLKH